MDTKCVTLVAKYTGRKLEQQKSVSVGITVLTLDKKKITSRM